jgi:MFS family permease
MAGFVLATLVYVFVLFQGSSTLSLAMKAAGLPASSFGLVAALNGVEIVLIQPFVIGWIGRRDRSRAMACAIVIAGLGFGLNVFAASTLEFAAAVAVWTLGEIGFATVAGPVIADLAPAYLRGRYAGAWGMAWSFGALLAPLGGTQLLGGTCLILGS